MEAEQMDDLNQSKESFTFLFELLGLEDEKEKYGSDAMSPSSSSFIPSHSLMENIRIKIEDIHGLTVPSSLSARISSHLHVYISCQLFMDGQPCGLPQKTSLVPLDPRFSIQQWIELPFRYCDVLENSTLVFTVWDAECPRKSVALGGTTVRLFSRKRKKLRRGRRRLFLWKDCEGDGAINTTTSANNFQKDTMSRLEKVVEEYSQGRIPRIPWLDKLAFSAIESVNQKCLEQMRGLFLTVYFPAFFNPVICVSAEESEILAEEIKLANVGSNRIVRVVDSQIMGENAAEVKHAKLSRFWDDTAGSGSRIQDWKPDASGREVIRKVLNSTCLDDIGPHERVVIWKARYYLQQEKKALTKFLRVVDWSDPKDTKEAHALLRDWAETDATDALELLSKRFQDPEVRWWAVQTLQKANNEIISSWLLQLVQALRYEPDEDNSPLAQFLISRAVDNFEIASNLFWYVRVASEGLDERLSRIFRNLQQNLFEALRLHGSGAGREVAEAIAIQSRFVGLVAETSESLLGRGDKRGKKIERMKTVLREGGWTKIEGATLPSLPTFKIGHVEPNQSHIFKSAKNPLRLSFVSQDHSHRAAVIYKKGDDLRQDQLVLQLIQLMDKLLQQNGLDLQLTPYTVLPTSSRDGFIEYVESMHGMADILAQYKNSILKFFQEDHADSSNELEVEHAVLDRYVRSLAGYSVITYILGIGDRHLDNIMLRHDGLIMHIDFGYILGRDPKPYPPPMKIRKEMIQAMGGYSSDYYVQFISLCCEAFNILRRHANLILNLLLLMVDAGIPDISRSSRIDSLQNLMKVQEKFRLDLSDEEAVEYMQSVISESVRAFFPQITEVIHRIAQQFRS